MDVENNHSQFQLVKGQAVKKWKLNVDPLLAEIALYQACNAEPTFHTLNAIRSGEIGIDSSNIPDLQTWFSYYKNHNYVFSDLVASFAPYLSWDSGNLDFGFKDILTEKGPIQPTGGIQSIFDAFIPQKEIELKWETSPPAVLFFILIWIPCNVLHGENPPDILFKARHGDTKAARQLLQLDKSILAEPGIARKMRKWSAEGRTDKLAELGSFLGEAIPSFSLKQVKLTWARFILETSQRDENPLTTPKIQKLFNSIAQDSGQGLQDPDIGDMSPEAFAKALIRKKDFWQLSPSE